MGQTLEELAERQALYDAIDLDGHLELAREEYEKKHATCQKRKHDLLSHQEDVRPHVEKPENLENMEPIPFGVHTESFPMNAQELDDYLKIMMLDKHKHIMEVCCKFNTTPDVMQSAYDKMKIVMTGNQGSRFMLQLQEAIGRMETFPYLSDGSWSSYRADARVFSQTLMKHFEDVMKTSYREMYLEILAAETAKARNHEKVEL